LNKYLKWEEVWHPDMEGDSFIKGALIPEDKSFRKNAAPIYEIRNAYAMWHNYLPENIWVNELYPLIGKTGKI